MGKKKEGQIETRGYYVLKYRHTKATKKDAQKKPKKMRG